LQDNEKGMDFLSFVRPGTKYGGTIKPEGQKKLEVDWSDITAGLPGPVEKEVKKPTPGFAKPNLKSKRGDIN
jgi:hypothetical protein